MSYNEIMGVGYTKQITQDTDTNPLQFFADDDITLRSIPSITNTLPLTVLGDTILSVTNPNFNYVDFVPFGFQQTGAGGGPISAWVQYDFGKVITFRGTLVFFEMARNSAGGSDIVEISHSINGVNYIVDYSTTFTGVTNNKVTFTSSGNLDYRYLKIKYTTTTNSDIAFFYLRKVQAKMAQMQNYFRS